MAKDLCIGTRRLDSSQGMLRMTDLVRRCEHPLRLSPHSRVWRSAFYYYLLETFGQMPCSACARNEVEGIWTPARSGNQNAPGVIRLYPAGANTQPTDNCPLPGGFKVSNNNNKINENAPGVIRTRNRLTQSPHGGFEGRSYAILLEIASQKRFAMTKEVPPA